MFYVIHGYCGPDHYTSGDGPILEVTKFSTATEVEKFYKEFKEGLGKDDRLATFRVIEGKERSIKAVERVTVYTLD